MMGMFQRHKVKAPEVVEAEETRDVLFAEADVVLKGIHHSVRALNEYAMAERRRMTTKHAASRKHA